jgi:hypothetical protein
VVGDGGIGGFAVWSGEQTDLPCPARPFANFFRILHHSVLNNTSPTLVVISALFFSSLSIIGTLRGLKSLFYNEASASVVILQYFHRVPLPQPAASICCSTLPWHGASLRDHDHRAAADWYLHRLTAQRIQNTTDSSAPPTSACTCTDTSCHVCCLSHRVITAPKAKTTERSAVRTGEQ